MMRSEYATGEPMSEELIHDEPRVTIEMGGANIVIRSSAEIDHAYTEALVNAVNAAAATDTGVVLDPDPIRCEEAFDSEAQSVRPPCSEHDACSPTPVEAVISGILRIPAERSTWFVDVASGRFCQTDPGVDVRFLGRDAWTPVIAVCLTQTRLTALTADGGKISAHRAHRPAAVA